MKKEIISSILNKALNKANGLNGTEPIQIMKIPAFDDGYIDSWADWAVRLKRKGFSREEVLNQLTYEFQNMRHKVNGSFDFQIQENKKNLDQENSKIDEIERNYEKLVDKELIKISEEEFAELDRKATAINAKRSLLGSLKSIF